MDSEDRSTQKDTSSSAGASSLSDLIARLEKATGPDREMDAEIFRAIGAPLPEQFMTAKIALEWNEAEKCFTFDFAETRIRYEQPSYTSSIDAAMTLALSGWIVESMSDEATGCVGELVITGCAVEVTNGSFTEQCIAATRPLATAGAWLKARSLPAI